MSEQTVKQEGEFKLKKRKTPKKDKIVDLKPKTNKIETQELHKLQSLVKGINQAQKQIGIIESQKHNMLHDIFEMKNYMMSAQKELEEKYGGTGRIVEKTGPDHKARR